MGGGARDFSNVRSLCSRQLIGSPVSVASAAARSGPPQPPPPPPPRGRLASVCARHPSAISAASAAGLRRNALATCKVRVLLPQLLRNQLQVRWWSWNCQSFSLDVDHLSTPCCSRDGLRCARHAMHASCTHRRTGRTPCSRRERTIAHAKSTPSANAARMPCAHQVHRSRTRG